MTIDNDPDNAGDNDDGCPSLFRRTYERQHLHRTWHQP
jgi:hypothetical protein